MRPYLRILLAAALCGTLALVGCTGEPEEPALEPTIEPPALLTAGELRVGVDLEYPPFAGTDKDREAGIDIDVASAIAEELGLTLATVQVVPSEAATALAQGEVDMVMSIPFDQDAMMGASPAGSYISNAAVFFAPGYEATGSVDATDAAQLAQEPITLSTVGSRPMGVQQGSLAYWLLSYEFGESAVTTYPTLRAAFEALQAGEVEVVGADAIVGAYILRDFSGIGLAGQIEPATQIGVAVAPENTELEQAVRGTLDALAANGVLDTIRTKWVGSLPALEVSTEDTP